MMFFSSFKVNFYFMKILLIFDLLIYKEFFLPIILSLLTAWQTIRVKRIEKQRNKAEEELNSLQIREKTQETIFNMLNRYEEEYAELNEKFLNIRKLYNESKSKNEGSANTGGESTRSDEPIEKTDG